MVCQDKPINFKIGTGILIFALILAVIGTFSPAWTKINNLTGIRTDGIWASCLGPEEFQNCELHTFRLYTVRSLALVGDVLLLLASISSFSRSKITSTVFGIIGGLCLITSVVLDDLNPADAHIFSLRSLSTLYWAFYLTGISGGLAVIASLIRIPGLNKGNMVHVV